MLTSHRAWIEPLTSFNDLVLGDAQFVRSEAWLSNGCNEAAGMVIALEVREVDMQKVEVGASWRRDQQNHAHVGDLDVCKHPSRRRDHDDLRA